MKRHSSLIFILKFNTSPFQIYFQTSPSQVYIQILHRIPKAGIFVHLKLLFFWFRLVYKTPSLHLEPIKIFKKNDWYKITPPPQKKFIHSQTKKYILLSNASNNWLRFCIEIVILIIINVPVYTHRLTGQLMKLVKCAASARLPINKHTPIFTLHSHEHSCTHAC